MKISDIAFVNHVGIKEDNKILSLDFNDNLLNHINTIHASAQFTLAETQSGLYLQSLFPELEGKVLPVLRDAKIKYKKPANKKIIAYISVNEDEIEKFKTLFEKKSRASIQIDVEIKDIDGTLTTLASFTWFIQTIK